MDKEASDALDSLRALQDAHSSLDDVIGLLDVLQLSQGADERDEAEKTLSRGRAQLEAAMARVADQVSTALSDH